MRESGLSENVKKNQLKILFSTGHYNIECYKLYLMLIIYILILFHSDLLYYLKLSTHKNTFEWNDE
jgi:hypothetical protein